MPCGSPFSYRGEQYSLLKQRFMWFEMLYATKTLISIFWFDYHHLFHICPLRMGYGEVLRSRGLTRYNIM